MHPHQPCQHAFDPDDPAACSRKSHTAVLVVPRRTCSGTLVPDALTSTHAKRSQNSRRLRHRQPSHLPLVTYITRDDPRLHAFASCSSFPTSVIVMSVLDRLPQDVLEDILLSLPDFNTLSAALRASKKHFLNPFSTRPKSTVWAIAYNVAGPSLPYAARLAFYESTGAFIDEDAVTKRPLHRNVCEVIQRNATVVAKLEDVFSQRSASCRMPQLCAHLRRSQIQGSHVPDEQTHVY